MARNDVDLAGVFESAEGGCRVRVKVVPGASRTKVVGVLGDRLKIAVAAPPEAGKANRAVCELLAESFALSKSAVSVAAGRSQPQKTIMLSGITVRDAAARLADIMDAR